MKHLRSVGNTEAQKMATDSIRVTVYRVNERATLSFPLLCLLMHFEAVAVVKAYQPQPTPNVLVCGRKQQNWS